MHDAQKVVCEDLNHICSRLGAEFTQMAASRLLITGGAGFLGYYLVQSVLYWNASVCATDRIRVTVYDNYVRGIPRWLAELSNKTDLELLKHDMTQPLPRGIGHFDYIVHAASIASPTYYRKYPIETMDANVNGLRSLLTYCRSRQTADFPVSGLLFFSTSEIYGDPDPKHIPTDESYRGNVSCTGPRACYDESKRYGETLCVNFASVHGLPIKVARPFNNYGPGLSITDRRVIPDFALDVLRGRDIVLLSDGSPTRTFCYVADAITGYFKILVRGRQGEAYNIGVENPEITIAELAREIASIATELFGYKGRVVQHRSEDRDYLTDNPSRRCPVVAKARSELGYNPEITLEDGLRRSVLWYAGNMPSEGP